MTDIETKTGLVIRRNDPEVEKLTGFYADAVFSPCMTYRYSLKRIWGDIQKLVMFIGLNPSTADHEADDPTIRRCRGFAERWGYGGMIMTNLFGLRSTLPKTLRLVDDPVGEQTDAFLLGSASTAQLIVGCWGAGGSLLGRAARVRELIPRMQCLGKTKGGEPRHPLYLRKDTVLEEI